MKYEFDADYKKMYYKMFNFVSRAIDYIDEKEYDMAKTILRVAQDMCEEIFISSGDDK